MKAGELIEWCNYIYEEDIQAGELENEDWFRLFKSAINDPRILEYIKIDWWYTTPIQKDVAEYGLPEEFIKERYVGIGETTVQENLKKLKRLSPLDFTNEGYKIKNNNTEIQIQPKPTVTNGYLHIYMDRKPKVITSIDDEIEILDPYILGEHALYQAETKARAFDLAKYHWNEMMERAQSLPTIRRNHPRHISKQNVY